MGTRKKLTLQERINDRWVHLESMRPITVATHVRDEMDQLAGQVQKLKENRSFMQGDYLAALDAVLKLIKERKK